MSRVFENLGRQIMLLAAFLGILTGVLMDSRDMFAAPAAPATTNTTAPAAAPADNQAKPLDIAAAPATQGLASILSLDCTPYIQQTWDAGWFGKGYYVNNCVADAIKNSADNNGQAVEALGQLCRAIPAVTSWAERAITACETLSTVVGQVYLWSLSKEIQNAEDNCPGQGVIIYSFYWDKILQANQVC